MMSLCDVMSCVNNYNEISVNINNNDLHDKFARGVMTSRNAATLNQSINQSIKIYIAPLQDTYSEALPTQAKRKRSL